jgi:hypothetical protein
MNAPYLRPHRGDLVLNLSILSLYFFPLGILAWILGGRDIGLMEAGVMDPSGRGTIHCARFIGATSAILGFLVCAAIAMAAFATVLGVRAFL